MRLAQRELRLLAVFGIFWLSFFFRDWYVLSYTKVWELSRMIGQPRAEQLRVLHPTGEMAALLQLNETLRDTYPQQRVVILAPRRDQRLPQAHDATILRAVLWPYQVLSLPEVPTQTDVLVEIIASDEALLSPPGNLPQGIKCEGTSEACPCPVKQKVAMDVVCWVMP